MVDRNIHILLVDDAASMRKIIKGILRQLGFTNTEEADDGTTALLKLQNGKIDLIICDWNMPEMTGIELLKAVRGDAQLKDTPFLMVTAEGKQDNVLEAVKADVSQYVVKPFTPEVLGDKIEKMFT